jgi:hypothetical protein
MSVCGCEKDSTNLLQTWHDNHLKPEKDTAGRSKKRKDVMDSSPSGSGFRSSGTKRDR